MKGKTNVTLSVNKQTYNRFSDECNRKGLIRSKVIENFMRTYGEWKTRKIQQ